MNQLYSLPGHLIRRAHQISTAIFAEECGSFDLTPVQYGALFAIGANPLVDATRLSDLIAFDRATIGDVLGRVEAKGWIVRTSSAEDRRVKLLRLTPAGRRILRRVEPAIRRVQKRMLEPLAASDKTLMVKLLRQLTVAEFGK